MKKITLFRNQKSKQSPNFIETKKHLEELKFNYNEASLEESIDNHNINYFFLNSIDQDNYLEMNQHYFRFGFSNFLVLNNSPKSLDLISQHNFKQVYLNVPNLHQFNIDLLQANQASLENVKKHIKVYFTGYLLESIIHELNNPLTSVTLNCQLILEMAESKMVFKEGQIEKLLTHTLNSLTKSSQITKNVLRYATFNSEEHDFFNLTDVFKNILLFTGPLFRKKQLSLKLPENEDFLVYANISDVNLLIVILFYLFAKSCEKSQQIKISYDRDQCNFSSDIQIEKLEDFYKGLFLPAFYVNLTLEEIFHTNKIQPTISKNVLSLTLPQTNE